jgi:hypothetical protein
MGRISLSIAAMLALALLPSPAQAAEPYEGAWVTSPKHCSDKADGPNSLTVIDLKVNLDGKPTPMVEQYEHHCFIDSESTAGSDMTVKATCYEFWDDYKKKVNGTKETIKLSVVSKDQLRINGKQYRRCPEKKAANTTANDAKSAKR